MTSVDRLIRRALCVVAALGAVLVAACANPALREARTLAQAGQHESALAALQAAAASKPDDVTLKAATLKQRDTTVAHLMYQAESARSTGQLEEVANVLGRLESASPGNPRAAWLRKDMDRSERHRRLMLEATQAMDKKAFGLAEAALRAMLTEDPGNSAARSMLNRLDEQRAEQTRAQTTVQLATAGKSVTLEFREAALRTVFEALARAADVNFVFDKDVRADAKVTLFMRNTTVDEALRVILNTQQLGSKLLNANTVLVYPNTTQKQRDLLDTVTRSFYLVNADPKQAQALVRTMAKTRDLYVDERLNLLVVRDTPEVVRLIERLIESIDLPDPEVMLELEVMEVSTRRLDELGLSFPTTASYGLPAVGTTAAAALLTSFEGLRWSASNPLAVATLRGSTDTTNLLANPKIRARNREKAKIMLGEKLPVFSSNLVPGLAGAASTTITYLDVGLKLEIEPQVQLDNDVTIKVALEVSSITGKVTAPDKSQSYQVGTRQATTTLRLKDGETQILAGLINDDEGRNSAGLPWLHDLPVVGRLFGTTSNTHNKSEIVLLITPRIVRNISQPAAAIGPNASGTEANPGAPPWTIKAGSAGSMPNAGGGDGAGRMPPGGSRGMAPPMTRERVTGPEMIMPGASFQVTVHNPTAVPLATALLYDTSAIEVRDAAQAGRLPVSVAPQGTQTFMMTAKPGPARDTAISLESGGDPLSVQIQNPGGPEAGEVANEPPVPR